MTKFTMLAVIDSDGGVYAPEEINHVQAIQMSRTKSYRRPVVLSLRHWKANSNCVHGRKYFLCLDPYQKLPRPRQMTFCVNWEATLYSAARAAEDNGSGEVVCIVEREAWPRVFQAIRNLDATEVRLELIGTFGSLPYRDPPNGVARPGLDLACAIGCKPPAPMRRISPTRRCGFHTKTKYAVSIASMRKEIEEDV